MKRNISKNHVKIKSIDINFSLILEFFFTFELRLFLHKNITESCNGMFFRPWMNTISTYTQGYRLFYPTKKKLFSMFHCIVILLRERQLGARWISHGNFFLNTGKSVIAFTICMLRWCTKKQSLMNQRVRSRYVKSVDLWIYELEFYCRRLIISSRDDDGLAAAHTLFFVGSAVSI